MRLARARFKPNFLMSAQRGAERTLLCAAILSFFPAGLFLDMNINLD
jgi:hypothetical protein